MEPLQKVVTPVEPYAREIEKKFTVTGVSYEVARETLINLDAKLVEEGHSTDEFWQAPNVDFVRFRNNTNELTIKVTDRGTVVNRIEENVVVQRKSKKDTKRLLTLLFGPRKMELTKKFTVVTLGTAIISLYEVTEDEDRRLFLEVESSSEEEVESGVDRLRRYFEMTQETRSLYQIFVKG